MRNPRPGSAIPSTKEGLPPRQALLAFLTSPNCSQDDGWSRTSVTGFADPRLTARPRRQSHPQHAGQGSNLPLPDLEAGAPPLGLPAYQSTVTVHREGIEPPSGPWGHRLYRPAHSPLCHLCVRHVWEEGFEPSTSRIRSERSAKLSYTQITFSQDGWARTSGLLRPRQACSQLHHVLNDSQRQPSSQRDSNPRPRVESPGILDR